MLIVPIALRPLRWLWPTPMCPSIVADISWMGSLEAMPPMPPLSRHLHGH